MRPVLYLFAALVASGATLGSAIPSEDGFQTDVIDTDLEAVPDGEVQKRDAVDLGGIGSDPEDDLEKRSASPDPEGDEDLTDIIDIDEDDLEPIPDGEIAKRELDQRGVFDCISYVCKNKNKTNCYKINARTGRCVNLVSSNGQPFVSGSSPSLCLCTVYSRKGCPIWRGKDASFQYSRSWGWSAKSIKCSMT
ncbi:hypothetical protein FQN50_002374 [Emmonsiellopsis sp. PD_5]|nr:hypothetical protein FQN50_002374 [Emmonsiellopsis sp. PD_5]